MEQSNEPKSKKQWKNSELILIDAGYVEGGGPAESVLEKNIISTSVVPGGFHFHTINGNGIASHTKNFYHS